MLKIKFLLLSLLFVGNAFAHDFEVPMPSGKASSSDRVMEMSVSSILYIDGIEKANYETVSIQLVDTHIFPPAIAFYEENNFDIFSRVYSKNGILFTETKKSSVKILFDFARDHELTLDIKGSFEMVIKKDDKIESCNIDLKRDGKTVVDIENLVVRYTLVACNERVKFGRIYHISKFLKQSGFKKLKNDFSL